MNKLIDLSFVMVMLLLFATFGIMGPGVESNLNPVITDFNIEGYFHSGDTLMIFGVMDKARESCIPEVVSFWQKVNGVMLPLSVDFTPDAYSNVDNTILNTRPEGLQQFGPWVLSGIIKVEDSDIIMRTLHDCHALWSTGGEQFDIPLKEFAF